MSNFRVFNPANGELLGEYIYTDRVTSQKSLDELADRGVLEQADLSSYQRSQILLRLSELIDQSQEYLAKMITLQTGKVIKEAIGEVKRAVLTTCIAAEEAKRLVGESRLTNSFNSGHQKISLTQRRPYGVVFAITPFNFPLNLAMHKIAAAFASGNTILYKPSDVNYELGQQLVQLCYEAGFPEHVIKFICPTVETLNFLVKSQKIQVINFTGGTQTANKICSLAGRKKLLLELGGNDALGIFSCGDIKKAAKTAVYGRFGTCGQKCIANKRVYIQESVYEKFKTYVMEYALEFNKNFPADPLNDDTSLGPLINDLMARKVESLVQKAVDNKAKVLMGHYRVGSYYQATILENVQDSDEIIKEETFGPVLSLLKFSTEQELIKRVNASAYGLQAGFFTDDLNLAKRLYEKIDVGTVYINQGPANRDEYLPFGGVKDSGMGREGVKYAMEEMSYLKQLIL